MEGLKMDYGEAAEYWKKKDAGAVKMDRAELLEEAEKFINAHNTCALAAGSGDFVRCTPLEYSWRGGKFWVMSEGGEKFRALEKNKNVCLAIYDPYGGFGELGGMQISGTAAIAEPWGEDYKEFLKSKKIPEQALRGLDHTMYLIMITPRRMDFLNSDFKKRGFASRQHIDF